jgi:GrpB-like predicted nucleotidyltransferase (UPF0157 family)
MLGQMNRQRFVDYDAIWPEWFEEVARDLRAALPDAQVEHYGSTSVPGLGGRPILDVQVALPEIADRSTYEPQLMQLGYQPFTPPDMAPLAADGMMIYVPKDGSNAVHLSVCGQGGFHNRRQLAVRDYLRTHPDEADAYAEAKMRAAATAGGVREAYARGKAEFVVGLQERALRWVDAGRP